MASRHPRRKAVVGGAVAVALVAGGGVAWAANRGSGPSYRLATVSRGTVSQTVTEVGSISSADQATLSFPVAGTVGSVSVHVGDQVAAGHTVAKLDTSSLQNAVGSARSAVADAEERLAADQDSETSTTASTPSTSSTTADTTDSVRAVALLAPAPSPTPSPTATSAPGRGRGSDSGSLARAKAAVTKAQRTVEADQAKVDGLLSGPPTATTRHVLSADLTAAKSACATSTAAITTKYSAGGTIDGTVSAANDGLTVTLTGTDANGAPVTMSATVENGAFHFDGLQGVQAYQLAIGNEKSGVTFVDACTDALTQVQYDETAVSDAERDLDSALGRLDDAVGAYLTAARSSGSSNAGSGSGSRSGGRSGSGTTHSGGSGAAPTGARTPRASNPSGTGSGSGAPTGGSSAGSRGSSGTGGASGAPATAQQIAADQKMIDAANAELALARQNLDQAVLVTPIGGTVAAVRISAGDAVSAGSSSATITVIGHGQKKITTTVGIADIDLVRKGEPVTVTVDGVDSTLSGTVSLIGIMNTSGTSGTTTTYPVTVSLNRTPTTLYDGAGATVAIHVGTKHNVLSVPASAVHRSRIGSSVDVYSGGHVTATPVQVGVRGVGATEITAGLKAGDRVVLAVVSDPVPSSDSVTNGRRAGAGLLGRTTGGTGRFVRGGTGP